MQEVFGRYRAALDTVLSEDQARRAAVHFFVNMLEAYYFADTRAVNSMLTVGQYLQPSRGHLPVERFVEPARFEDFRRIGEEIGFANVASGPLVRSSYHADRQAAEVA